MPETSTGSAIERSFTPDGFWTAAAGPSKTGGGSIIKRAILLNTIILSLFPLQGVRHDLEPKIGRFGSDGEVTEDGKHLFVIGGGGKGARLTWPDKST